MLVTRRTRRASAATVRHRTVSTHSTSASGEIRSSSAITGLVTGLIEWHNPFSGKRKPGEPESTPPLPHRELKAWPWGWGLKGHFSAGAMASPPPRLHEPVGPAEPSETARSCAWSTPARPVHVCTDAVLPRAELGLPPTLSALLFVSPVRTGLPHQAAGAARTESDDHHRRRQPRQSQRTSASTPSFTALARNPPQAAD